MSCHFPRALMMADPVGTKFDVADPVCFTGIFASPFEFFSSIPDGALSPVVDEFDGAFSIAEDSHATVPPSAGKEGDLECGLVMEVDEPLVFLFFLLLDFSPFFLDVNKKIPRAAARMTMTTITIIMIRSMEDPPSFLGTVGTARSSFKSKEPFLCLDPCHTWHL